MGVHVKVLLGRIIVRPSALRRSELVSWRPRWSRWRQNTVHEVRQHEVRVKIDRSLRVSSVRNSRYDRCTRIDSSWRFLDERTVWFVRVVSARVGFNHANTCFKNASLKDRKKKKHNNCACVVIRRGPFDFKTERGKRLILYNYYLLYRIIIYGKKNLIFFLQ